MLASVHVYVRVCACVDACVSLCVCVCVDACVSLCVCVYLHFSLSVCMYACSTCASVCACFERKRETLSDCVCD